MRLIAYHGTGPEEPLVGGQDPVSRHRLTSLWASNSYRLAAQFQDGEVRKLEITLENPLIVRCDGDRVHHAKIVREAQYEMLIGESDHDGVVFIDTIDGLECGDVVAVFGKQTDEGLSVDHAVRQVGRRYYDETLDDWVSDEGFTEDPDDIPWNTSWMPEDEPAPSP